MNAGTFHNMLHMNSLVSFITAYRDLYMGPFRPMCLPPTSALHLSGRTGGHRAADGVSLAVSPSVWRGCAGRRAAAQHRTDRRTLSGTFWLRIQLHHYVPRAAVNHQPPLQKGRAVPDFWVFFGTRQQSSRDKGRRVCE